MIRCEELEDLIAAFSLGALTPEEMDEVNEHLSSCDKHPEVAEMEAVASALVMSAPERQPLAALKSRIMAEVSGDARRTTDEAAARGFVDWLRDLIRSPWVPYAMSGAAIFAVALFGLYFGVISDDDSASRFALTGDAGASGELVVEPGSVGGHITATGLAPLPEDQTYQVWALSPDATPAPAGFLTVSESGEASGVVTADLSSAIGVAVTIEPAGGSAVPTSPEVLYGDL